MINDDPYHIQNNMRSKRRKMMTESIAIRRNTKLGDRITSLHQLVSPFGKTDTASVLSEAINHIKDMQEKIEFLTMPYMRHKLYSYNLFRGRDERIGLKNSGLCVVPITYVLENNIGEIVGSSSYFS
ncbi:hypothetical protein ZOSMA_121G00370 [Zostera marina]|uniref:BHLH domain-containing protein n=1 Tax=Zostera marina TaxID=29655 RepID=A0A0K9Q0Q3_ZOSMR|nr:hypothetical protein ZOSMA_121G00370 [Zostera marina]